MLIFIFCAQGEEGKPNKRSYQNLGIVIERNIFMQIKLPPKNIEKMLKNSKCEISHRSKNLIVAKKTFDTTSSKPSFPFVAMAILRFTKKIHLPMIMFSVAR